MHLSLLRICTHTSCKSKITHNWRIFFKNVCSPPIPSLPTHPPPKKPVFTTCTLTIQKRDPALHIFNVSTADKAPGIVKLCLFCNVSSSILVIVHQLKFLQAASVNARIIYPTYHQYSKTVSFNLLMLHMRRISVYKNLYTEKWKWCNCVLLFSSWSSTLVKFIKHYLSPPFPKPNMSKVALTKQD